MLDGLALGDSGRGRDDANELALTWQRLAPRWFIARNAHAPEGTVLLQPRWAMSFMRGPMTRNEIRMALSRHRSSHLQPEPTGVTNGQSQIRHPA